MRKRVSQRRRRRVPPPTCIAAPEPVPTTLPFGPVRINRGDTEHVVATPQVRFRGKRLAYVGPPGTFALRDVLVGRNSQFACAGARVPMEMYSAAPAADSPGVMGCVAPPGTDVILVVENISRTSAEFDAVIFGEIVA